MEDKKRKNESLTLTLFLAMTWCTKMTKKNQKGFTTYDEKLFARREQ